jgi:chromate reductase
MKKVFAICGSTRSNSSNLQLLNAIKELYINELDIEIYNSLFEMPHFNPDLQDDAIPSIIHHFRNSIKTADGVLICTPEYVFSLPGVLKNAIEWTIATTVFSEKPVALITASGLGQKAHESLLLIMKTIYASYTEDTQLLISGARTKVSESRITDDETLSHIQTLMNSFINLMAKAESDLHGSKTLQ